MAKGNADGVGNRMTIDDLVEALDRRDLRRGNVPKVDTFLFKGEQVSDWMELVAGDEGSSGRSEIPAHPKVSDWLDLVEQALMGLSHAVKFQRILKYVLHSHHQEVEKVLNAVNGSWTRFKDGMQREYRLGDGLLTIADLEAMNRDDFTTVGAFVQEFKKKARKVPGISEEAHCAIFLGLLTASEATELTSHIGGSAKLTWATIDEGVEQGSLDQVEQYQMRLQRRKRKERDATASRTPGVKRIVTDVLVELGYGKEVVIQEVVTAIQGKGKDPVIEEAVQEEWEEEEPAPQHLSKALRKQRNLTQGGQGSRKGQAPQVLGGSLAKYVSSIKQRGTFTSGGTTIRAVVMACAQHLCAMGKPDSIWADGTICWAPSQYVTTNLSRNTSQPMAPPPSPASSSQGSVPGRGSKCVAMVDTGAKIDRSDCGILHGANCKAVFCGTASNVLIEVGRVKAWACFFIMPDVDHGILLGRSFLCRTRTLMFNKHDGTLILIMCDPACGNYEIITCRNIGPRSVRNRLNPGSFTIEESEDERQRLHMEPEEEERGEVFSLSLSDVNKVMDIVATHKMADPNAIQALREQVLECPQAGELKLVYQLPGGRRDPALMQTQAISRPFLGDGSNRVPEGGTRR
ncbi:hypothetical protein CBR_g52206 [Chara braunii]|uniref:Uncharacterized protein n=1 Tax=Chara braunii TaxID=69332 RepID=A0A388M9U5_CHABU|nr:hypothetical protein CBR_g52206 [Chara braunii]|eukprot:GBG91320.1 hypothetical protein CBR_g52206 [Chara braunii]